MLQALQKADSKKYLENLEKMGFTKKETEKQFAAATVLAKLTNEELLAYDSPTFDTAPYNGGIYGTIYLRHPENPITFRLNSQMKNKELPRYIYSYDISSFGYRKQTEFLEEVNTLTFKTNIHQYEFDTNEEKPPFDVYKFVQVIDRMSKSVLNAASTFGLGMTKIAESIHNIADVLQKFEINNELRAKIINKNASRGWTIVSEVGLSNYLNEEVIDFTDEELDKYFEDLFYGNNNKILEDTKESILFNIGSHNYQFTEEVFEAFDNGLTKVVIPSLILLIEGTMADIVKTKNIGKFFKADIKGHPIKEQADLNEIIFYAAFLFVADTLYVWDKFDEPRKPIINRNRILHGRDNSELWTDTDALRLIVVLGTLTFFQELSAETKEIEETTTTL